MITFLSLKDNLKNNRPLVLCMCGNDHWVKRKAVSAVSEVYEIADDLFSTEWLDAPTYKQIETACCSMSLFCTFKLVVCENFVFPQGKQMFEVVDKLSQLVTHCDGSFCLVFLADSPTGFDKISAMTMVNCDRLDANNIIKWIVAYGKRQGVQIDMQSARKIGEYCLWDMSRVSTETQKLLDYGTVSCETVEMLVHKDTEYVVFNLSKTISNKDANSAIQMYKGLIAAGEEARGLFGLLYNFYRRAYYVKTSNLPTEQLANYLAVKPFAVDRACEIAQKYKAMQLKTILDCFEQADVKLKNFLDETEVMITLIMQIVSI